VIAPPKPLPMTMTSKSMVQPPFAKNQNRRLSSQSRHQQCWIPSPAKIENDFAYFDAVAIV